MRMAKTKWRGPAFRVTLAAFTLIELLVVIAIIAILAGLLLPVLSRAKGKARQIQCLSQTHQLALGLQMYAHDNNDALPWPNWGRNGRGWLYQPFNGLPPEPSGAAYQDGLLWPYIKNVQVYWCPADNTNKATFARRVEKLSSYIMNGGIMAYYRSPPGLKTHKISDMNTAGFATWEPSDDPPYNPSEVFNDGASYPIEKEGPSRRHSTGCNVTSFDGHAQFLKFDTFQNEQNVKPGLLWCDPDTTQGDGGNFGRDCSLWK